MKSKNLKHNKFDDHHYIYMTCKRKKRFNTLYEAERSAKRVFQDDGTVLYPYQCDICNGFHLTSMFDNKLYQKKNKTNE